MEGTRQADVKALAKGGDLIHFSCQVKSVMPDRHRPLHRRGNEHPGSVCLSASVCVFVSIAAALQMRTVGVSLTFALLFNRATVALPSHSSSSSGGNLQPTLGALCHCLHPGSLSRSG